MNPTSLACFVTGTDTEVGKTHACCALLRAAAAEGWHTAAMKPVAAGAEWVDGILRNDDVERLRAASSMELPRELVNPFLYREPLAPHIAAAREGRPVDPAVIVARFDALRARADCVVVEGVGGFRVPLGPAYDTADLARELALPVILVVGLRLGCLNHALLTAEAIAARGVPIAGWIANPVDPSMAAVDANVDALRSRLAAPCLAVLPRGDVAAAAAALAGWTSTLTRLAKAEKKSQ